MAIPTLRGPRLHRALWTLAACVGVAVCSSDSAGPGGDDPGMEFPDGLETVSCVGLSPASASGIPSDRIAAGTVPASLEPPLAALVLTSDGGPLGATWLEVDPDGRVDLRVPLHPSGSVDGGQVLIRATDGKVACEPWIFTVEPLTPSPGEAAAVLDGLQDILREQATTLGTTPELLQTTPLDVLPRAQVPLAIVQWLLDHPDNGNSLRALIDGAGPGEPALERADALLARTGLRAALEANAGNAPGLQATAAPSLAVEPEDCTPAGIGEDTQKLSDCMGLDLDLQAEVQDALGPRTVELGTAVLLESTLPGLNEGRVRDVLGGLGLASMMQQYETIAALPSSLDPVTVEVDPDRYAEDDSTTGTWTASVTARGGGMSAETLENALGSLITTAALSGVNQALSSLNGLVEDFDAAAAVARLVPGPVRDFLEAENVPEEVFGPVPIDDEMWSEVSYEALSGSQPSVQEATHTTYRPVAVGRTELVVEIPGGDPGVFGGHGTEGAAIVEVEPLVLRIEPSDTVVPPGNAVDFRVTVENALTKGPLEARSVPEAGGLSLVDAGAMAYTLRWTAPADAPEDIGLVVVEDESTEGARANGPPRADTARARIAYVSITTLSECTAVGAPPIQMETERSRWLEDSDLVWSARLGTVSPTGRYTPPETAGVDTVSVALRDYPEIRDFLVVPVGGCSCQANFSVDGSAVATSRLRFTLTNDLSAVGAVSVRGGAFEQATFGFGADPRTPGSVAVGFTGTVQGGGAVSGVTNEVRFLNPDDPDDPAVQPLTVAIRENTGSVLSGNFSGQIAIPTNDTIPRIAPLSFDFYIQADPTLSSDQVKVCEVPAGGP